MSVMRFARPHWALKLTSSTLQVYALRINNVIVHTGANFTEDKLYSRKIINHFIFQSHSFQLIDMIFLTLSSLFRNSLRAFLSCWHTRQFHQWIAEIMSSLKKSFYSSSPIMVSEFIVSEKLILFSKCYWTREMSEESSTWDFFVFNAHIHAYVESIKAISRFSPSIIFLFVSLVQLIIFSFIL